MSKNSKKKIKLTEEELELLETGDTGINFTEFNKSIIK
jgi:ketosteroid isomerase-like protein